MEKQNFKISIEASPEKVWKVLWSDDTYPLWTAVFSEGSRVETDWKEGSKVLFLNDDNDGMVSTISKMIPNQYMSFEHLGIVKKGVENLDVAASQGWAGSKENYTLQKAGAKTELLIDMDIVDEFKDYFAKTWPLALDALKNLAEQKN